MSRRTHEASMPMNLTGPGSLSEETPGVDPEELVLAPYLSSTINPFASRITLGILLASRSL